MPSASLGSNQVDFGGMIAPASATAMRSAWNASPIEGSRPIASSKVCRISAAGSAVSAWVVPTDEELMIARHTLGDSERGAAPRETLCGSACIDLGGIGARAMFPQRYVGYHEKLA